MSDTDKRNEQYRIKVIYSPCGSTLAKLLRDIILNADLETPEKCELAQGA